MASPAIFKGRLTKFLTNGGILIPARPQTTDASVVPTPGELAYDTENENFVVYQDGAWEVVAVFSDLIATNIVNTPYGTITAVNVQTALNELSDEKVQKSGDAMTGNLTFANNTGIESTADVSTLNIGTTSFAHNVNIGTGSHTSSVNIGTGTGITTINIGGAGDTVNIGGELVYVDVSTLQVEDKDIVVNKNGAAGSGNSAGLHVEEGGVITGFNHVANSRQSWEFIAPASPGAVWLTPSVGAFVTEIESSSTTNRTLTLPDTTDTLATQTQITDVNNRIDDLTTDDVPESVTPTNKYFTDARAKTAVVVNTVAGDETDRAPSVSSIVTYVNTQINALDTDDIEEGTTNKYFTDERAQDAAWNALDAGTNGAGGAISVQYDDALNKLALVIGNASTTTRGAALFNPFDFDLDAQQRVVIKDGGVNNTQLENSSITLNGSSVSLGGSAFVGIVNQNISANSTLAGNSRYLVNTSGGAVTATLPSGTANAYIEVKDAVGSWDSNNLTIVPATGQKINGYAINESLICDVRDGWVSLAWDVTNSRWNVSTTAAINLDDIEASVTQPGIVSTGAQTFAGNKTFTGNLGIGTVNPSSYGHGGNNKVVEILNPTTTINSQSHYMISSGFNTTGASALGTVSWALPNVTASEKLSAYVGATTETGHTLATPATAITFATRNSAGAPAERVRIDSSGNLLVGTNAVSSSHVFTKATSVTLPSGTNNTSVHITNRNAGAATATTGWLAASFGSRDNAAGAVVIGSADGRTYIGAHNSDLTQWSSFNIRGTSGIHQWSTGGSLQWRFGGEVDTASNTAFIVYNAGGVGVYVSPGATSWTANSDERMKKNIKPLELGLEQIKALKPARFDYNNDESNNSSRVGFIAQEVLPVLPHAVTVPEDSDKFMGVANTEMIPVLVKAIQELSAKNEELVARIAALENTKG